MNTKEIWIKSIPGHWERLKKPVYIIGLGETDNEAGRRVIVPYEKSSLGKKLNYSKYVKVLRSKNEIQFYYPGSAPSKYKIKLVEELRDGANHWEADINEAHYLSLEEVSITPNELTKELYIEDKY